MITFLIGLAVLLAGGLVYGRICERIIRPTDRKTPALEKYDVCSDEKVEEQPD